MGAGDYKKPSSNGYYNKRRARILKRDKCLCYLCGTFIYSARDASVDHIIAKDLGGTDDERNLAASHIFCNYAKGNMTLEQFRTMASIWASHRSKYEL